METDQHVSLRVLRVIVLMSKIKPWSHYLWWSNRTKSIRMVIVLNILGITFRPDHTLSRHGFMPRGCDRFLFVVATSSRKDAACKAVKFVALI